MMTIERTAFYLAIDELLEIPSGSINSATQLAELEAWDSLAVISFIAMADKRYGVSLPAKAIAACRSVDDLAALVERNASQ